MFYACASVLLIVIIFFIGITEILSLFFLCPLFFSILYLFKSYKLGKIPLFSVSENEFKIFNPLKIIAVEKITAVKQAGKNKLELILTDEVPVPLFLNELSGADRKDLKSYIERIISRKE